MLAQKIPFVVIAVTVSALTVACGSTPEGAPPPAGLRRFAAPGAVFQQTREGRLPVAGAHVVVSTARSFGGRLSSPAVESGS